MLHCSLQEASPACRSIPQTVLKNWQQEREALESRIKESGKNVPQSEQARINKLFSNKMERFLDAGYGACWLKREDIATLAVSALHHFNRQRYHLWAWCVMPNHIHVVVQPLGVYELHTITHSWKSYTANQANKRLNREGTFWQPEYFDHFIF